MNPNANISKDKPAIESDQDCDSWCRTVLCKSARTTFKWTIENFNSRPEERNQLIESSIFKVPGPDKVTRWFLKLYPKGGDDDPDYIVVDLHSMNDFEVRANADVSVLAPIIQEKNKDDYSVNLDGVYKGDGDGWGGTLLKIDDCSEILPDGNLTLLCKLEVYGQDKNLIESQHNELDDKCFSKVNQQLGDLCGDKTFSDVKVMCEKEVFHCHRAVLSARSPVFKAMFQSGMSENRTGEVDIEDVKAKVVSEMLHYIYKGRVSSQDVLKEMAKELLVAADKYQLDLLKKLCEVEIRSSLDESNCIELLIFSDTYQAKLLKKGALQSVFLNLASIVDTDVYKEFHKQHSELSLEVTRTIIPMAIKSKNN